MTDPNKTTKANWIVMSGQPVDTDKGGGFEFYGPFTETEARKVRDSEIAVHQKWHPHPNTWLVLAIELLSGPKQVIPGPEKD